MGLSYKKNIDDLRESSSLKLIKLLNKENIGLVSFSDPHIKTNYINTRDFNQKIRNIKITANSLSKFDIVVLMTDHDTFDYEIIKDYSKFNADILKKEKIINYKIDITSNKFLKIKKKFNFIIDCSADPAVEDSRKDTIRVFNNNLKTTLNI